MIILNLIWSKQSNFTFFSPKAKMGCLDKSKLDWEEYVAKEGIKEELTTFNKGKDGSGCSLTSRQNSRSSAAILS